MRIESLNNSKVKEWSKLKEKKYRDQLGLFLVEGDHLLNRAILKDQVVEIISIDETLEIPGIPFYLVTKEIMKKLSCQVTSTKIIGVCQKNHEKEIMGLVCLLDNIQDPGNLGTIIRSAVAFNFNTIILSNDSVDLYNDKVIRSSQGMIFQMNILRRDLGKVITDLKKKDYVILGTDVFKGIDVKDISPEKFALIMGNEGSGVKAELKKMCDKNLYIKMNSKVESLNVGVATSILLYELNR